MAMYGMVFQAYIDKVCVDVCGCAIAIIIWMCSPSGFMGRWVESCGESVLCNAKVSASLLGPLQAHLQE